MTVIGATSEHKEPAWTVFPELESPEPTGKNRAPKGTRKLTVVNGGQRRTRSEGRIRSTTLSFATMHKHGDLFQNFLRARKKIFIDELHWSVPHNDGMEFDQYDNPFCRYVIVHEYGEILGGLRLTPTSAKCGVYSYMLRDAQQGLLESIPRDVLFIDAPVNPNVWEGTRLFITEAAGSKRRLRIQGILMGQLLSTAHQLGATHLLGFVPSSWARWIRRIDLDAVAVGPKINIDGVVSQAALMNVVEFAN